MQFWKKNKNEKWRTNAKNANQTRDQLDKHDLGKKYKNLGKTPKSEQNANQMQNQIWDQLDKHDFGNK